MRSNGCLRIDAAPVQVIDLLFAMVLPGGTPLDGASRNDCRDPQASPALE